jgi:hypothetical protein
MDNSITGVIEFTQRLGNLFQQIKTVITPDLSAFAGLFDEASGLVQAASKNAPGAPQANNVQFDVAGDPATKQTQQGLVQKIQQVTQQIVIFQDDVDLVGHLYAARSNYYATLANTYNNLIEQVVQFTAGDVQTIQNLLTQATLDENQRQQEAAVLDAVVKLTELGLAAAAKFA